jgi:hypothetical protein
MSIGRTVIAAPPLDAACVSLALAKSLRYDSFMKTATVRNSSAPMLVRISEVFGLSHTDLGRLFGVSRQAASQWIEEEPPAERLGKVLTVVQIADLLALNLIADRIPAVARTPADAYGGRTMLQMIAQDRHQELLASVRDSFDWSQTA